MELKSNYKSRLKWAFLFSIIVHALAVTYIWIAPTINAALGLRGIQFVDEAYDRAILIDFSQPLHYPPGYIGFSAPKKPVDLDKVKAEEERRKRLEAKRRAREEAAKREAEEKARQAQQAQNEAEPKPSPTPNDQYPGGFGKINTAPIKDQLAVLYEAKKAGKLVLPEGKLKVGVAGQIKADGSLADCRITVSSGNPEIDRAALAILDAVSESHALGPLHELTSLSLILDIDQQAELNVVGFASSDQAASTTVNLANAALLFARFRKADDPAAMVIINNLKVTRTGQRVQANISMPRQMASDALAKSMEKDKGLK